MYNIGICDDGENICTSIENMLLQYAREKKIQVDTNVWYTGESLRDYLVSGGYLDILFLDIELFKMTGIEVSTYIRNQLDNMGLQIVYISGKASYAQQLFKTQPLDFLVKPILQEQINEVMDMALKIAKKRNERFELQQGKEVLMPYRPYVFCVNPKATSNYRKSYIGMEKTDPTDAYLIADFGRVGRTKKLEPWRGGQFIALKRLTRHRMHLSECITREKTYMVSNLYLKFSELQLLEGDDKPFGSLYGAASPAVLTEFLSPQEIIDMPEEDLLAFFAEKSRNRISDISKTSELLRKAARDSYRLDKCMYEPLNISLASSFNCIHAYQKEIRLIEQAIEKCINGMNPNALIILRSIPGIGSVWASGILSEIGDITTFHSSDALAKYAGLYWPKGDSGDFTSEDNQMSKAGNPYLRYYLGEAANSVRKHIPEYADFYARKYAEVTKHQHKRALALTSRKFVRLVFGLLVKNQLYTGEKLDSELNIKSN